MTARPLRSALYIPGSKPRALEKARGLPCDAIIFDLEDAVAPAEKAAARGVLVQALAEGDYAPRLRIVRINALSTLWGREDAAALQGAAFDAVLLPKVESTAEIDAVAALFPALPVWAMIETPRGVLNAAEIARNPRLGGMVIGTNDLVRELGCRPGPDRAEILQALQLVVLAARAGGVAVLDGVYNAFRDADGLAREAAQGRALGMDGKTLIHPDQIAPANAAFTPTPAECDDARRIIAAHAEAEAGGQGVAVLDGRIVESLHVATAQATLERMEAIIAAGAT